MMSRLFVSLFVAGAVSLLLACGLADRSFMDDALPACVPIEGALNEPCERRIPWSIDTYPAVHGDFSPDVIGSLPLEPEEEFRRDWMKGASVTPQVILRGVVIPNSTRCTEVLAIHYDSG